MKQGFVSISEAVTNTSSIPISFENLKVGKEFSNEQGRKFTIERGIPADAKLVMTVYVYESESLDEDSFVCTDPPQTVTVKMTQEEKPIKVNPQLSDEVETLGVNEY